MASIEKFRRKLAFEHRANRRLLKSTQTAAHVPVRVGLWFPHMVAVQREWLGRILGRGPDTSLWPEYDLDELRDELDAVYTEWDTYLASIRDADLATRVSYENHSGGYHTDTIGDILDHVLTHSQHHRSLIAAEMRIVKGPPTFSDFVIALDRAGAGCA